MAIIIDGKELAKKIRANLKIECEELKNKQINPKLAVIMVGDDPASKVYVRKSQYTKSDLGFSLGAVTPTAVSKKEVHLTFVGAANLNEKIKGIEYSITVQGGERIASGVIGKTTNTSGDEITFKLDSDRYPYLDIAIPDGKELGVNNTINITYYYLDDDGNISVLKLGDKTTFDYSFKNENK